MYTFSSRNGALHKVYTVGTNFPALDENHTGIWSLSMYSTSTCSFGDLNSVYLIVLGENNSWVLFVRFVGSLYVSMIEDSNLLRSDDFKFDRALI